jgi:hypothetical protein
MKLIVTNQFIDITNKFLITIYFLEDGVYEKEIYLYIDEERYKNDSDYTVEVHNLIEALEEVSEKYCDINTRYSNSIEEVYSKYKIIRFIEDEDYDPTIYKDLLINVPITPNSDSFTPFFTYIIKYIDNEGISWNVNIEN